ncbi:MAG: sensor histidine kinase, partial [Bryobacteraceae bacterium]
RDITERRRAEVATGLLASIVETSDDAILTEDMHGTITSWNRGAERIFGYSGPEVLGKSISILAASTHAADLLELHERIKRGEHVENYQTVHRTKTGELIHVSITMSPVRDAGGRITGISKITRDMTAWIEAQREIAEQRERLQVTLSSIGDGVIATDVNSCISYLNPVAEALTGWHTAHAVGRRLDEVFRIINEESRQALENPVTKVLREGKIVGLANHTLLITRDGRELAIDDSGAPIRNGQGESVGTVLVFRDVTERRADEAQLERQAAELRRANGELSQFAYAISHDLREPLRNIANFTELLVRQYSKPLEADTRTHVDYILNGVSRMEALLNDLLAYSQVGGGEARHGLVATNGVVEKVLADLHSAIVESGAQVTADYLPQVCGHEPQLTQLFQNLIGNAIKYRSVRPLRIHIGAQRSKGEWVFSVRDNGVGIAPEYHDIIFGVFKRLHGRDIPGTGIGLAICAKVIERHGGRIWVESQPGEGSEFFFSLAALPVGAAAAGEGSRR